MGSQKMKYHLVVTPAAFLDINAAVEWYDEKAESLGNRFISAMESRFEDVLQSPLFSRLQNGSQVRRIYLNHWPYFIYYRVLDDSVRIIAVIHTSRDPKYVTQRISS